MQYPQGAGTDGIYKPVDTPMILVNEPEISRTRRTLMILIGIILGFAVIGSICSIVGVLVSSGQNQTRQGAQLGQSLISLLFYGFGFHVTQKYKRTGLRVFAWFGVISLVLSGILILTLLALGIGSLALVNRADTGNGMFIGVSVIIIFVAILCIASFVLTVIIVKLAFKLARLIDANQHLTNGSIKI